MSFYNPIITEIKVDHNSKSCLILTPSNDEKNFLIGKLGFLDTKNVKIKEILDSNLVITRKSRVDTYLTSYLKFLELLTNLAKICHAKRVFSSKLD